MLHQRQLKTKKLPSPYATNSHCTPPSACSEFHAHRTRQGYWPWEAPQGQGRLKTHLVVCWLHTKTLYSLKTNLGTALHFSFFFFKRSELIQFSSVAQSCMTLCNPMNRSTPDLPVHHQLLEFTQTHVHRVNDAIQPSHPLSSPSPPAPNPSQHQSLFQWVNSLHEVAKVLELQL